jgi:hypothetical protein
MMKRSNPFSLASNGRKRPRTDSTGPTYGNHNFPLMSFPHTPGLLAEPQYEHVQTTVSMRPKPAKSEACSLLSSLRMAKRTAPPNYNVGHDICIIANTSTALDMKWSDLPDTIKLDLPNESSLDDKYWSELLLLLVSVISILIGFYMSS